MRVYDDVCDMLNDELRQIAQKNELTSNALDVMGKAVDIIKDLSIVKAMEESGYSEHYPYYFYGDEGYAMDNGHSYGRGRYARRDSMGRYSTKASDQMISQLQNMMNSAQNEDERRMVREWMEQVKQ